ncbi:unnamed protein product [Ambrosiozyma monospora]|uniref:Unnamed protein product n=1 Tax=Ambrosiozyma monospora TaxID=43982 RepID=A0ACB5TQ74_AMBMO|nr:unnamed protein product [Ambrosiozyma monospora]
MASTGASGALFGSCIAANLMLLILNQSMKHYDSSMASSSNMAKEFRIFLAGSLLEIVIMIVLGLLPGMDNFSHIGGFIIGVALSIALLNDPFWVYSAEFRNYKKNSYGAMNIGTFMGIRNKIVFGIWCVVRFVMLIGVVLWFVLLVRNFKIKGVKASESCKWCKYINCLPVNGWCELGDLSLTATDSTNSSTSTSDSSDSASSSTSTAHPDFSGFACVIGFIVVRSMWSGLRVLVAFCGGIGMSKKQHVD